MPHWLSKNNVLRWCWVWARPGRLPGRRARGLRVEGVELPGDNVVVEPQHGTDLFGRAMEHQETYLQTVLGFFGITDVRFVRAEGVAMGDDAKAAAFASAESEIRAHIAEAANQPKVARTA